MTGSKRDPYRGGDPSATDRADVLVELDLPPLEVQFDPPTRSRDRATFPSRVHTPTPAENARIEQVVTAAHDLLRDITGEEPVWIAAARAFRVTARLDQLPIIAASHLVRSVSPNRRLPRP
jgi:hypothetical protein